MKGTEFLDQLKNNRLLEYVALNVVVGRLALLLRRFWGQFLT
jgi:hypothetical protein